MSDNLSGSDDSFLDLFDFPLSPLYDSSSDYDHQGLFNSIQKQQNPVYEFTCLDQPVYGLLSSSPPRGQFENISLYQTTQFPSLSFGPNLENEYENFSGLNCFEARKGEIQVDFGSACGDVNENVAKYLQTSISSSSFEGKPNFSFQPPLAVDPLKESHNFEGEAMNMPESGFPAEQMRKVCSNGDWQNMTLSNVHTTQRPISIPSAMEETPFNVRRCNPKERQEKISKYRAKRKQRNFNKTIKYECRKTLADKRPRIRGRFASYDQNC